MSLRSLVARARASFAHVFAHVVAFVLVAMSGCAFPTASCPPVRSIAGTWNYSATQDAPASASATGTLVVSTERCGDFAGLLDVIESTAGGQSVRMAAAVNGVLVDSVVGRFDVSLGEGTRQHLARFAGDSVSGTWVMLAPGVAVTGRFVARRREPP